MGEENQDHEQLLSLADIEREFKIHRSTIYRYTQQPHGGLAKYRRVGDRRVFFKRGDVIALLQPKQISPRSSTDEELAS